MDSKKMIAKRTAEELIPHSVINLGIGIPTIVADYLNKNDYHLHTENGLLGVTSVEEEDIDPLLVNAGKLPVGEAIGASYFSSADSFGMIRGGHVDVAILGALQVDEKGIIANWAVPGKGIIGVGGAMDLLIGARQVIVTMGHTSKDGTSKLVEKCTYPITSTRSVNMIITDLAVFKVINHKLILVDLMPEVTLDEVREKTEAHYEIDLKKLV